MATVPKRILIVLVPTLVVLLNTWLVPALLLRGHLSPEGYGLLNYGAMVPLVVLTGWMSARYGDLGRRAAAFAGALVFLLGKILPLAAIVVLKPPRSGLRWGPIAPLIVVVVLLLLVALQLGYLGAWIATRTRSRPRHS